MNKKAKFLKEKDIFINDKNKIEFVLNARLCVELNSFCTKSFLDDKVKYWKLLRAILSFGNLGKKCTKTEPLSESWEL